MESSFVCHHTINNKRNSTLNLSNDHSDWKALKNGKEEEFDDLNISSILNETGTSVASNENTDVLARLGADYNDSNHPNDGVYTRTPFLLPREDATTTNKKKKKKMNGYVGSLRL